MEEQAYVVDKDKMLLVYDFEHNIFFPNHNSNWASFFDGTAAPKKCVHDFINSKRSRKIRVKHITVRGQAKCPARSTLTIMLDDINENNAVFTFKNKQAPGVCNCLNAPAGNAPGPGKRLKVV